MEGNRDESEKCIELAEQYINSGKRDKALKFLNKAERLYPSKKAKDLVELLQTLNGTTNWNQHSKENGSTGSQTRHRHKAPQSDSENEEKKKDYTEDQLVAVRKIKKSKDYYEILGVSKDAGENDLKRQYKKLALQFHPDKNKAPGASEAFKAIGNAFAILNDPSKRKRYDMHGSDDYISQDRNASRADYEGRVYTQRANPNRNRFHRDPNHQQTNESSNYGVFFQLTPLLILIAFSVLGHYFQAEPAFSLIRTSRYIVPRTTYNLKIQYYVKKDFDELYKTHYRRIEQEVEDEYVQSLRSSCFKERSYKENLLWRARAYNSKELHKEASSLRTPSCQRLQELYD
ncbi:DnaJ subfamily B member 14 [Nymphon striatum]|nr:DnaJ subfamily B member 14 [Nymphon striatum]